ncbi:MAG: ABC transporter ATP-binding protein [Coriobacteriales bacterium]|nr:ABC transporter ATP-binding protein [Coriobacteriales bacterium]
MAFLSCKDLCVGYGGMHVAENISLEVGAGDLLCVIGENGAGKSTLVKTLLGLIEPLSGEMTFGDGLSAGDVGYLPQRGETQRDFPASVWEIVLSGCLTRLGHRFFYSAAEREVAERALERVGAQELRNHSFSTLSGGQQQRVLIARALCAAERLLVLDEPMTGLDPQASSELYDTIERLRAEGMGVISVSHDVDVALEHASHVLQLGGEVVFCSIEQWREGTNHE